MDPHYKGFFLCSWCLEITKLHQPLFLKIVNDKSCQKGGPIQKFPCTLYATGMIFKQENCPSGRMLEDKLKFSGKHKLYSYKTEVFVVPTGQAINDTDNKPGSISDLIIFQHNLDYHNQVLNKYGDDTFPSAKFPENWAILIVKGYHSSQQQV